MLAGFGYRASYVIATLDIMAAWPKVNNHDNDGGTGNSSNADGHHDGGYSMLYSMRKRTRQEVQTGEAMHYIYIVRVQPCSLPNICACETDDIYTLLVLCIVCVMNNNSAMFIKRYWTQSGRLHRTF
jgi:hypothetical protein